MAFESFGVELSLAGAALNQGTVLLRLLVHPRHVLRWCLVLSTVLVDELSLGGHSTRGRVLDSLFGAKGISHVFVKVVLHGIWFPHWRFKLFSLLH